MAQRSEEVRKWGEMHQDRLMKAMDVEWDATTTATEVAVVVLSKRKAETYGTHARTARAIMVMVPDDKPVTRKRGAPAPEEEAPMHDQIPDDPTELRAAVESEIAGLAQLIELKRREERPGAQAARRPQSRAFAVVPQHLSDQGVDPPAPA